MSDKKCCQCPNKANIVQRYIYYCADCFLKILKNDKKKEK